MHAHGKSSPAIRPHGEKEGGKGSTATMRQTALRLIGAVAGTTAVHTPYTWTAAWRRANTALGMSTQQSSQVELDERNGCGDDLDNPPSIPVPGLEQADFQHSKGLDRSNCRLGLCR